MLVFAQTLPSDFLKANHAKSCVAKEKKWWTFKIELLKKIKESSNKMAWIISPFILSTSCEGLYACTKFVNKDGNSYENIIIDLQVLYLSKFAIKKRSQQSFFHWAASVFMSMLFLEELLLSTTLINQLLTASVMSQPSTNVSVIA